MDPRRENLKIKRPNNSTLVKTSIERKSFELDLICKERARIFYAENPLYGSRICIRFKEISSANSNSTHGAPVEPLAFLKNCMHVSRRAFPRNFT